MKRLKRTRVAIRQMQTALSHSQPRPICRVDWVSTFPKWFEGVRDRLAQLATFSAQSLENRLFSLLQSYPWWYGHTAEADAQHHAYRQQYAARRQRAPDPAKPVPDGDGTR